MLETITESVRAPLPICNAHVPYPWIGGSQYLCLVRDSQSIRSETDPRVLQLRDLPKTVLAGAYFGTRVQIDTGLEAPYTQLLLPPLRRSDLQEERVYDQQGRSLGVQLRVPDLFVRANNILINRLERNERYRYRLEVSRMVTACGRLLASSFKRNQVKVRTKPGFMGHAQALSTLHPDHVGISVGFGRRVLQGVYRHAPELFHAYPEVVPLLAPAPGTLTPEELGTLDKFVFQILDGLPTWTIRYPLANQFGIQPLTLRILPGTGRAVWINPVNLEKLFLGDEDGDVLFCALRVREFLTGTMHRQELAPVVLPTDWKQTTARLSLYTILQPEHLVTLGVKAKTVEEKFLLPDLTTTHLRKEAIHNADTRQHVAVYTMVTWWLARVLSVHGGMSTREAYRKAYSVLQWYMENCMDARKGRGNSAMASNTDWDPYAHMEILLSGGELDWEMLARVGLPPEKLAILKLGWELAGSNLRESCATSPVYWALVLRRRSLETSLLKMLAAFKARGVMPGEIHQAVVADLTGSATLSWPEGMLDQDIDPALAEEFGEG